MAYFKSFLDKVLANRNQHNINVMTAEEIDRMNREIEEVKGKLAAYELERERGDRKIHPALKRMRERAYFHHKI